MSDKYRLFVPELIDEKIAEWELPPSIFSLMESRLRDELCENPVKHLRRVTAPWEERLNLYSFTIRDPDNAFVKHLFMFVVVYGEDEQSLNVVDCGHQMQNSKPN